MHSITPAAWQLSAASVWNAFSNSGKRHLLFTGSRGIGKTTLLSAILSGQFSKPLPGLTSRAVPGQEVLLTDNLSGKTARIGVFNPEAAPDSPKMKPCAAGFCELGIPALQSAIASDSSFVSLDEIGFLESDIAEYCKMVRAVFEAKRVLGVLRKQDIPFLHELSVRDDVFLIDLDHPFGNFGCIIMASGLGKRFGSNKLLADFLGRPLIQNILDTTEGLFSFRTVVTRHEAIASLCRSQNIDVVLHDLPLRSDTVRLGTERILDFCTESVSNTSDVCKALSEHVSAADRPKPNGILFCPSDQPLLRPQTIQSMLLLAAALHRPECRSSNCLPSPADCPHWLFRPAFEGIPGAPVLFSSSLFPELLTLPEGKGGGFLAKKYPKQVHTLPVSDAYELKDIDTPEALSELVGIAIKRNNH